MSIFKLFIIILDSVHSFFYSPNRSPPLQHFLQGHNNTEVGWLWRWWWWWYIINLNKHKTTKHFWLRIKKGKAKKQIKKRKSKKTKGKETKTKKESIQSKNNPNTTKTIMTKNIQRFTLLTLALFVVWQHGNLWKGGRRSNRINVKYFKTIFPLWYIFRLSYITKTVSLLPFKEKSSAKLSKVSPKMNQREVDCDGLQMYLTSHWSTNRY